MDEQNKTLKLKLANIVRVIDAYKRCVISGVTDLQSDTCR